MFIKFAVVYSPYSAKWRKLSASEIGCSLEILIMEKIKKIGFGLRSQYMPHMPKESKRGSKGWGATQATQGPQANIRGGVATGRSYRDIIWPRSGLGDRNSF